MPMPTKPRGYYSMQERDEVITNTAADVTEMHEVVIRLDQKFTDFLQTHKECQKSQCAQIAETERKLENFKRDNVKIFLGIAGSMILLLAGLVFDLFKRI
jgi:hypothetical protein